MQGNFTILSLSKLLALSSFVLFSIKVPVVGLEPTTLAGRDFESRAYANSATPAFQNTLIIIMPKCLLRQ